MFLIIALTTTTSYASTTGPYSAGYIEGFVKEWVDGKIRIEEYDGTEHLLSIDPKASFMIDGRNTKPVDFKPGMEVYAVLTGRNITYIEGFSTENPGYIAPGGKMRSGTVQKIDRDQIILKLPTGDLETYFTSSATIAMKKGVNVPLSTLYEGDRVKFYFDEIDTSMISRMQIEGNSVIIKDLYKGKLTLADRYENTITLESAEVYKNGKWELLKSSMSLPYSDDIPVYAGGQKIPYKNLKYYSGKTVYMAIRNFFGSSRIEKMVLKSQYESAYSEKIREINWFTGAFELSNNRNITFNEGTVIIKNGRLVDSYAVSAGSDAFVVTDGRDSEQMADVVYIYNEEINNSNIGQFYLYSGRLDEIVSDRVVLKDFFLLNQNNWESFSEDKEFYYDSETYLYDLEEKEEITPEEFYSEYYAVDESSDYVEDNDLEDWYGYLYTDGDRIACISMQKDMDSLLKQRITNGTVDSISEDSLVGWTIQLKNAADWSGRNEKWMQKKTTLRVNLEKAMIIKDGRMIPQEDINPGDRLYIVRDDFTAKVVIVK